VAGRRIPVVAAAAVVVAAVVVLDRVTAEEHLPRCRMVEAGFGPDGTADLRVEVVAEGLEVPWGLAFLPDGQMLVTERAGRVRLVRASGELVADPVAEVEVVRRGEGGLLGIALHPDFGRERSFYLYLTAAGEEGPVNRVERWRLDEGGARAEKERVIVDGIPAARVHNGGRIAFGPDGMLYVGTGDAGDPSRSQDRRSLAGKILRVSPQGEIPGDNPWPESPVYLTGIRNAQGFDWREDGALVVADHGPSGERGLTGLDEVSLARAGDNLGWPVIHGCGRRAGMVTPVISWAEAVPPGGAAIVRGDALRGWSGDLVLGTLGSRHLHRIRFSGSEPDRVESHEVYLRGEPPAGHGRLRAVAVGPDGALYLTTSNCDGRGECPAGGDRVLRVTVAPEGPV
jgi:aldose sugar dehydrogenase